MAMQTIWQGAPHAALRVWHSDVLRWELNAAARRDATFAQWDEDQWQALATLAWANGKGRSQSPEGVGLEVVALGDGLLAWLVAPDPFTAAGLSIAEPMDLAREHGRIGLFVRDLVSGAGYWDRHAFGIFGVDPAQGVPSFDAARALIHPEDLPRFQAELERLVSSGGRHIVPYRIVQPSGAVRHLNTAVEIRPGPDGTARYIVGAIFDDTDSVQRSRESAREVERLARGSELAGVAMWHQDFAANLMHVNSVARSFIGLPPGEGPVPREAARTTMHPDDLPAAEEARARALASDRPVDFTARYRTSQGNWRTLLTRGIAERDREGQPIGMFGVSIDITDRLETEQVLQRARERESRALEAAEIGVWERELDGSPRYWSAAMRRLRGIASDDPRSIAEIASKTVSLEMFNRMQALALELAQTGLAYEHEFEVRLPDGSTRWLATKGSLVRDADGTPLHVAGINFDITERRQAQALRHEKQRIEEASRAKTAFLSRMSHELRTPMNAVLGFSQLLADDRQTPLAPRQQERVRQIRTAGEQMMTMIDELLELAGDEAQLALADGTKLARQGAGKAASLSALCIEDNPVNLLLVQELFALRPHMRLATAVDGASGLAQAQAEPPDLLLLDMQLPDIDGMEVMQRVRADPHLGNCRIVALSANAMHDDVQAALAAGFDAYWTKPINFSGFLAALDALDLQRKAPIPSLLP